MTTPQTAPRPFRVALDRDGALRDDFPARLMQIAELYYASRSLGQATAMYRDLIQRHPASPEAGLAQLRLEEIHERGAALAH